MKRNNKSALDQLLAEITPEEQDHTDIKMLLAAKIADAMKAKGWNNSALMNALGKSNPSEITRWLSGTHNFTTDTLIDLQRVLDIKLLDVTNTINTNKSFKIIIETNTYNSWYYNLNEPREQKNKPVENLPELSYY